MRFRPDVEGLRAVAVALVVADHAGVGVLDGGFVGVDVFLVVSGFLITRLLLADLDGVGTGGRRHASVVLAFYARRARRILPLAAVVLAVVVVATYAVAGTAVGARTAADATWVALFAGNLRFAQQGLDYFATQGVGSPLAHYWSLGVEEQFYLVWPLLVVGVALVAGTARRRRRLLVGLLVVVVGASLAWSVAQTASSPTWAYYSPLTRAHELAVGALVAVLVPARPAGLGRTRPAGRGRTRLVGLLAPAGLALVVGAALLLGPGSPFPGALALLPVVGTALVLAGGELSPVASPVARGLGWGPLRWLGQRSYGVYLWHLPLLALPAIRLGVPPPGWVRALLVLAAVVLAAATYRLVEQPVRRARPLLRRGPWPSLALGAWLVVLAVGTAQVAQAVRPLPTDPSVGVAAPSGPLPSASTADEADPADPLPDGPAAVAEVAAAVAEADDPLPDDLQPPRDGVDTLGAPDAAEARCDRGYDVTRATTCVLREGDPDRAVVLYGDSHASMWAPALLEVTARTGRQLLGFVKYGCPPLVDTPAWHPSEDRPYTECDTFGASALQAVEGLPPATVVVAGGFQNWAPDLGGEPGPTGTADNDDRWDAGLSATVEALRAAGHRVVVLGDIAFQLREPDVCLATSDRVGDCSTPRERAVNTQHLADEEAAATASGATYVPTVPWLCTDETCPAVVADLGVYRDSQHLTRQYAAHLARALGEATGLLP